MTIRKDLYKMYSQNLSGKTGTGRTVFYKMIFFLVIVIAGGKLIAQQSNTLFLMQDVPQANLVNPAVQIPCKWYVSIPLLGSVHADYSNTAFSVNDLFELSLTELTGNTHKTDLLSAEVHLNLLSIGYRRNDYYINFGISEKANLALTYPGDLVELGVYGNGNYIGETLKLNNLRVHGVYYREYALGVSKVISPLTILGGKAKLLFGKANIYSGKSELTLETDNNTFDLTLDGNITINSSYPLTINQDTEGKISGISAEVPDLMSFLMNSSNIGFAIDLGIIHRYDERITLSASLLDLGFINWKSDVNNISVNGSFTYSGANLGEDFTADSYLFEIRDSLYDAFNITVTQDNYYSWLPTQIYLGGEYQYGPKLSFGLTNRNVIYRNKLHSSLTLSGNYKLFKNFSSVVSWSYLNNTIKNVGLGLALHGKGLQFHILTDNILAFFDPLDARNANLRFGINLMLGCGRNKEERLRNSSGFESLPGNCHWIIKQREKAKKKKKVIDQ